MKNKYPFPRIDDLFYQMRGEKVFSKIDMSPGYHRVRIKDEYIHNIVFITRYGHCEFVVVLFGLTNAPTTIMCLMNSVFSKYLDKFVLVFLDDILIYSKNEEEHEEHLRMALQLLRDHKLYAKRSKYDFYPKQNHSLGHIISEERIFLDLGKIETIMNWPILKNVKNERCFYQSC